MCGILGNYTPTDYRKIDPAVLSSLSHRGPDDEGFVTIAAGSGRVTLGHTRLAIIDLSAGGHQPIRSSDGRFHLVFNGEIYNYRELRSRLRNLGVAFESESDTEVLLKSWIQWGAESIGKLNGMFAFAILDTKQSRIHCVRDAFGIKPLYYSRKNNEFHFASEVPALTAILPQKPRPNIQQAYDYLTTGLYDDGYNTFFEEIYQLPPGHLITIDLGDQRNDNLQRWWQPEVEPVLNDSFETAANTIRHIFLDNIRLHMRSDVPLGAALSGGIDSAAVVCGMRKVEPQAELHTFSFVAKGSEVDEEPWVDLVARHVNAHVHKVRVKPEELSQDLDTLLHTQGEPFGDTSIYAQYRVFQLAREKGIKVTLDGQGADELLAGYQGYPTARAHSLFETLRWLTLSRFIRSWSQWPGRSRQLFLKGALRGLLPRGIFQIMRKYSAGNPEREWVDASRVKGLSLSATTPGGHQRSVRKRRLASELRRALTGYGLSMLLRHGDRNSMHWSVESRVPFLTTEFARYTLKLPENYLLSSEGETKSVFRAAMRGIVPDAILDRRDKIGFATPESDWLGKLQPEILKWLEAADTIPFVKPREYRRIVQEAVSGKRPYDRRIWRMINYCRWSQIFL
ncbi:MAG: asparagine synthase (glutamine-hydrolyzing) [Leptospiraceae bacterium]|nr:asparagine synthase (glutamine-hydrolyzing) [Leptospiraceae bacterium]